MTISTLQHVGRILVVMLGIAVLFARPTEAEAEPSRILALGDSLTAGYGLPPGEAFPVKLEAALRQQGLDVTIANAGVSGDTSAGGLARVDWSLADRPGYAILALGANDGLRGLDPRGTYANLDEILTKLQAAGTKVLMLGMLAPPNFGREYQQEFERIFPTLAAKHKVALYPFFLDGVAGDQTLNQADGIHPNARGVDILVQKIAPLVTKLVTDQD